MSFLDELGEFLESVRAGEVAALRVSPLAIAGHLRQLARWFQDAADDRPSATHELTVAYDRWSRRCRTGLLEILYERVALLFSEPPLPLARLVDLALAELVDDHPSLLSSRSRPGAIEALGAVRARTLSIAGEGAAAAFKRYEPLRAPSPRRTAELLRLIQPGSERPVATAAGALFLQLGRRERLRWLFALELATSEGPCERERFHPALAKRMLQYGRIGLEGYETVWVPVLLQSWEHEHREPLDRWVALGLVEHHEVDAHTGEPYIYPGGGQPPDESYALTVAGRELLADLLTDQPHPLRELANAMLADEEAALPSGFQWPQEGRRANTRVLSRYTKILTHEVRNALMPVQFAAQQVASRLEGTEFGPTTRGQIATMEAGLTRLFNFVDNWRQVMEQAEEPGAPFSVVVSVRDAIAASRHELERPIELHVGADADDVEVVGKRDLFTQALVELIRNAVQAAGPRVNVTIEVEHPAAKVRIIVCDDGPGIPLAERERVFQRGVTLRADGTGQGLADVRDIIGDMSGEVHVEVGEGAGARFVITLPSRSRGAS